MKKKIKLPSGRLGSIPEGYIDIDLEMKARHYDALTTITGDHYEEVVLSILKDLMEQDPYKLTNCDLQYVFTLVKIASISSTLKITLHCPQKLLLPNNTQRVCNADITFGYSLAKDDDVVYCELKELPTVTLPIGDKEETFAVHFPTMTQEIELLEKYETAGHDRKSLLTDKAVTAQYAKERMAMHLITNQYTRDELVAAINDTSFKKLKEITDVIRDLDKYGLKHKEVKCTCKECGGTFNYRLPLFSGLSV